MKSFGTAIHTNSHTMRETGHDLSPFYTEKQHHQFPQEQSKINNQIRTEDQLLDKIQLLQQELQTCNYQKERMESLLAQQSITTPLKNHPGYASIISQTCKYYFTRLCTTPGPLLRKISDFDIRERRGSHLHSPVWRAMWLPTDSEVALKRFQFDQDSSITESFREAMILFRIDHPFILKLDGIVSGGEWGRFYIQFPFYEYDLASFLSLHTFDSAQVPRVLHQILSATYHLHTGQVAHRDIKPTSLLWDREHQRIKLCSFSSACSLLSEPSHLPESRIHFGWAPELIYKRSSDIDWKAADMWSVGWIFAYLLCKGKRPLFSQLITESAPVGKKMFIDLKNPSDLLHNVLQVVDCQPLDGEVTTQTPLLSHNLKRKGNVQLQSLLDAGVDKKALGLLRKLLTFCSNRRLTSLEAVYDDYFEILDLNDPSSQTNRNGNGKVSWCPHTTLFHDSHVRKFVAEQCGFL
eukprot:TRINITY_DN13485_c0_g1_i1.p1 TRINITY_DN13485_c0_g1~~TRINITY_DN13485_c0_g1_i1.p1  ORF type:complete len:465 (-),score=76.10 TRINITY_DN13485_c0_g1_i1:57-1451(-)